MHELPVFELMAAGDPYVGCLIRTGRINELRDDVIDRLAVESFKVKTGEVG